MASEELKLINLKIRSLDERLKYAKISKRQVHSLAYRFDITFFSRPKSGKLQVESSLLAAF